MKRFYKSIIVIVVLMYIQFVPYAQIIQWEECNKFLGNISAGDTPANWLKYWNQVTPENAGKWGSVESTRDVMNWSNLDKAYNLAKNNDLIFKLHVLVWGSQQPSWIESLTEQEQLEEIVEWVMLACERYPDTDFIEVVNEPLHAPPYGPNTGNYANALGGNGLTGRDWIIKAFEIAKEHCPNAKLMINDYGILNDMSSLNSYLGIVDLLKARDLIDAIGVQSHAFTVNNMKSSEIKASLDKLAVKGLPIYVTELDIDTDGVTGTEAQLDELQLTRYKEIFPALWSHSAVKGITLWGYVKNQIWRETGYLVSSTSTNATERPALVWLKNYITERNSSCGNVTEVIKSNESLKQFNLFPNPVANILTLSSESSIENVGIMDIGGRLIQTTSFSRPKNSIELPIAIKSGVYLVEVTSGRYKELQRIVVQ